MEHALAEAQRAEQEFDIALAANQEAVAGYWRALYEFALLQSRMQDVESLFVHFNSGAMVMLDEGQISVTYNDLTLTLEQLKGYVEALEQDAVGEH